MMAKQIRTKCYAPKFEGAGKIGYSVYELPDGKRFVKMDGNHVKMGSPGTISSMYFKVNDSQFENLDVPFAFKPKGYKGLTLPPETCNNDTTPGFLRAVLKHYFEVENELAKGLNDNPG